MKPWEERGDREMVEAGVSWLQQTLEASYTFIASVSFPFNLYFNCINI